MLQRRISVEGGEIDDVEFWRYRFAYSESESGVGGGEIDDVEFWRYRLAYSEGESGVGGGEIDDVDAVGFEVLNQFF